MSSLSSHQLLRPVLVVLADSIVACMECIRPTFSCLFTPYHISRYGGMFKVTEIKKFFKTMSTTTTLLTISYLLLYMTCTE